MTRIGIVGAGAAGAAAAYALRGTDAEVTVLEKSGGVCGRAATRRRGEYDYVYDYGANYLKAEDERVTELVTETLPAEGLVDIREPVWTFDADGRISEGRDADEHKYSYERGLTQIAKRLFDRTEATVERRTRVEALSRDPGAETWTLTDAGDGEWGPFDLLLLTPPAPQTATLLRSAAWDNDLRGELATAAESVPYRSIITAVLGYEFEIEPEWYALVNVDKRHDVGWLAREECKTGHVPDGESVLVVQMAPDWSQENYEADADWVCETAAETAATLLDDDRLTDPAWTDHQGWRYALPDDGADRERLARAADHDLFFGGDWVAGEGRLHLALRNGLEVGEELASRAGGE
jgi:predicted NAD/FAD-dependent oxidoreductase